MDATQSEQWRPVVGYEGYYDISDQGRVRRIDTGRVLKQTSTGTSRRYKRVTLCKNNQPQPLLVHILVMRAFIGERPERYDICHYNGDGHDNRLSNLRYDTRKANHADKIRHGTNYRNHTLQCPQGHDYIPGRRHCRECARAANKRSRQQRLVARPGPGKPKGERVAGAKLNEQAVRDIRVRAAVGETFVSIAAIYAVTDDNVAAIVKRKSWKHVV